MIINTKYVTLFLYRHPYFKLSLTFHKSSSWYNRDFKKFKKALGNEIMDFPTKSSYPCIFDKYDNAGRYSSYFIQDLYIAQKIYNSNPIKHVDIGSRIDGFVGNVATFRQIEVLDIRNLVSDIPNIKFTQVDLMDENLVPADYCDSISSLHALEHFGLGRYGDCIDPNGHLKGFHNITKMLKSKGVLYLSIPMGQQRIEFNAHRVFGMPYLLNLVSNDYDIVTFSYIDDNDILHTDAVISEESIKDSFGCIYGCALFVLKKK